VSFPGFGFWLPPAFVECTVARAGDFLSLVGMAFPTTQWSLLAQATLHGDSAAGTALAEFYRRYRDPVIGFISRQPAQRDRAEDLAQEFFLFLMDNSTLRRADRARGRFRSFLLATLMRFLSRDRARWAAEKRGAGEAPASLDDFADATGELAVSPSVARAFDREWAQGLLVGARAEVEAAWAARGLAKEFATLQNFLPGSAAAPAYEAAAATVGWPLARLKTEVFRLRQQFREQLRAAVALTVDAPDEVAAEMAHLHAVLADSEA
jgi:DNA-directed RNA polymerase specialized sigma24 family protein